MEWNVIATTIDNQEVRVNGVRIIGIDLANGTDLAINMEFNQETQKWESRPLDV